MSILSFIYSVIVLPIEAGIEFVFYFIIDNLEKLGVTGAIVAVSLVVNFLALPIYNVADEIQLKERNLQKKMSRWVSHLKKTFKGDEQFMMLNEYYRQNNYHPLYALRQSLSIIIEIPFFIAAYHFLSHCSMLENQSAWVLKNLAKPDALIPISLKNEIYLNLLPILMTLVNVVSSIIYTKDAPLREKIQVHALALVFLVILYNSPSGLVFYWILNNIFSLAKNIILKMKHPGRIVYGFLSFLLIFVCGYMLCFKGHKFSIQKSLFYLGTIAFTSLPFVLNYLKSKGVFKKLADLGISISRDFSFALILVSCISLWILCGLLIPTSVISSSPAEFLFLGSTVSPFTYIFYPIAYFAGLCIFWPICVYKMFCSNEKVKVIMPFAFFIITMCAIANVFLFRYDYGTLNVLFKLDNATVLNNNTPFFTVLPIVFMIFIIIGQLALENRNLKKISCFFMGALCLAQFSISLKNCVEIGMKFSAISKEREMENDSVSTETTMYNLSKTEPNVFVLFLDRAIPCFFPYILDQFLELKDSFDGFTFYPNTVSFADFTNSAVPAMCGGYDYTIDAINKRKKTLLRDKHNESLKVLPTVFRDAGFESSVYDLPYEDYESGKDIWEGTGIEKPEFPVAFRNEFYSNNEELISQTPENCIPDMINRFSIFQILYPPARGMFYGEGDYHSEAAKTISTLSLFNGFIEQYIKIQYLPEVTGFTAEKPTFHYVGNSITHEYTALREGYVPGVIDEDHPAAGTGNYKVLQEDYNSSENDFLGYHVNAAAILQVGKWLDYLKENEVYDNTRIIIVADHGRGIKLPYFEKFTDWMDIGYLNPLLLVKDFNCHGEYKTDMEMHTNADVPYFATKDLNVPKKNPFTGNDFKVSSDFDSFNVYRVVEWSLDKYKGKTQFPLKRKTAFTVRNNIFDESNWKKIDTSNFPK